MGRGNVKQYITKAFGDPAELSTDMELRDFFLHCLQSPDFTHEYRRKEKPDSAIYTQEVNIIISEDDFYRYGWALSKTDQIRFGRKIEKEVKQIMRNAISTRLAFSGHIKNSILFFQDHFDFPEDVWSFDSIKKEFYRKGVYPEIKLSDIIDEYLRKQILGNLSDKRTITNDTILRHEINK